MVKLLHPEAIPRVAVHERWRMPPMNVKLWSLERNEVLFH